MSIEITKDKILLNVSQVEYNLLMFIRREEIRLERLKPGGLMFHFDDKNKIRKYELHLFGKGNTPVNNL